MMGKSLSMDLRARALSAVDGGMSRRAAARRFGVSISSVIRWDAARRLTGTFSPRKQGGDTRSRQLEAHHALIIALFEAKRDQSLDDSHPRPISIQHASSSSTKPGRPRT